MCYDIKLLIGHGGGKCRAPTDYNLSCIYINEDHFVFVWLNVVMFTNGRHVFIKKRKARAFCRETPGGASVPCTFQPAVCRGETVRAAGQTNHQSVSTKPLKVDV